MSLILFFLLQSTPINVTGTERLAWEHDAVGIMRWEVMLDGVLLGSLSAGRLPGTDTWRSDLAILKLAPSLLPGNHTLAILACTDAAPPAAPDECSNASNTVEIVYSPGNKPKAAVNLRIIPASGIPE